MRGLLPRFGGQDCTFGELGTKIIFKVGASSLKVREALGADVRGK